MQTARGLLLCVCAGGRLRGVCRILCRQRLTSEPYVSTSSVPLGHFLLKGKARPDVIYRHWRAADCRPYVIKRQRSLFAFAVYGGRQFISRRGCPSDAARGWLCGTAERCVFYSKRKSKRPVVPRREPNTICCRYIPMRKNNRQNPLFARGRELKIPANTGMDFLDSS